LGDEEWLGVTTGAEVNRCAGGENGRQPLDTGMKWIVDARRHSDSDAFELVDVSNDVTSRKCYGALATADTSPG
jgi:hypothetical protein